MKNNVAVIGGGSFGTSIAQQLANNENNSVTIFLRDQEICHKINRKHRNIKYFPNRKLNKTLRASMDYGELNNFNVIILAIPSNVIGEIMEKIIHYLVDNPLIINMAKGLQKNGKTIVDYIKDDFQYGNVVSLKGPAFSYEIFNNEPTLLTLGYKTHEQLEFVRELLDNTNLFVDFTPDIRGVEYLSSLKNIYAIYIGNIDAKFNSANTKYFIFTKCVNEINILLKYLGCRESTTLLGCGIGDFSLTALNDLSRNRTLGLLIGKGFYNVNTIDNTIVLEGVKTLYLLNELIDKDLRKKLPILNELIKFFVKKSAQSLSVKFNKIMRSRYKTVLTYGTFDLLHYGHLEILKRAKDYGDKLIVGLSTDAFNLEKGKVCEFEFEKRKQYLESLDFVDEILPENSWDQKVSDIVENKVDYFIMGDDWKGKFDFLREYCEVIYLPRTQGVSTTELKEILKRNGES